MFAFRRYLCYTGEVLLFLFIRNHFKRKKDGINLENRKAKAEAWQAVKFTLFSASAGLIQVVSFELLSKALKLPYWGSYLTALVPEHACGTSPSTAATPSAATPACPGPCGLVALFYAVFTPVCPPGGGQRPDQRRAGTKIWCWCSPCAVNFVTEFLYQTLRGLPQPHRHQRRGASRANGKKQEGQSKAC